MFRVKIHRVRARKIFKGHLYFKKYIYNLTKFVISSKSIVWLICKILLLTKLIED